MFVLYRNYCGCKLTVLEKGDQSESNRIHFSINEGPDIKDLKNI